MKTGRTVVCTLDVGAMRKRQGRWLDLAERAFVERAETRRGLRLVFRNDTGVEDELRELARLERRCCAFADWTVGTAKGVAVLEVRGDSAEAVAAVQSMFETLEASASPSQR